MAGSPEFRPELELPEGSCNKNDDIPLQGGFNIGNYIITASYGLNNSLYTRTTITDIAINFTEKSTDGRNLRS
jgi:hypothetical protein